MKLKLTTESDLTKILEMERNVENTKLIIPYDLERHIEVMEEKDEEHLSIYDENSRLIGFVILAGLNNVNKSIEFKRIVVSEKSRGFGSTAIDLIKKRSFEDYSCNRLWLDVFEFNKRAIYVYEKLGFHEEGVLRECIKTNNGFENLVVMSILKWEYDIFTADYKSHFNK